VTARKSSTWRRRVDELVHGGMSQDDAILQAAREAQPRPEDDPPLHGRAWSPRAPNQRMIGA
jgi:hypothetical protein